jgi:hypothetical protein
MKLSRDLPVAARDRFMTVGDQIELLEDTNKQLRVGL